MKSFYQEERQRTKQLRKQVKDLIYKQLTTGMDPYWFISFHYTNNKTNENEVLKDVADLKNKIRRIAYKYRDRSIKDAGSFPYPKMLFIHEQSHLGTGQYHTHMILERMPILMNTQAEMEDLFRKELPSRMKALSRWKRIDIQRVWCGNEDLNRLADYLSKQHIYGTMAIDAFNSDLFIKS